MDRLRKTTKNVSQVSRLPRRNWNTAPIGYMHTALPLLQPGQRKTMLSGYPVTTYA